MSLTTSRTVIGLLLPCMLGCASCTTFKPIAYDAAVSAVEQVDAGERLRVVDVYGEEIDLTVTGVKDDYIEGRTADGASARIDLAQVREIERRQRSPAKTAALVGGLTVFYVINAIASAYGAVLTF
jgi:hypothetical protein